MVGSDRKRMLPTPCRHDKRVLGGFHRAGQRGVGSPPLDIGLVAMHSISGSVLTSQTLVEDMKVG
jgi:hypothetical protein